MLATDYSTVSEEAYCKEDERVCAARASALLEGFCWEGVGLGCSILGFGLLCCSAGLRPCDSLLRLLSGRGRDGQGFTGWPP